MAAVVEKLVPTVQGCPLRLEDHQAFLLETKAAAVGSWTVGFGTPNQRPGDEEVLVLHQPLFLQAPDVGAEAGCVASFLLAVLKSCLWLPSLSFHSGSASPR